MAQRRVAQEFPGGAGSTTGSAQWGEWAQALLEAEVRGPSLALGAAPPKAASAGDPALPRLLRSPAAWSFGFLGPRGSRPWWRKQPGPSRPHGQLSGGFLHPATEGCGWIQTQAPSYHLCGLPQAPRPCGLGVLARVTGVGGGWLREARTGGLDLQAGHSPDCPREEVVGLTVEPASEVRDICQSFLLRSCNTQRPCTSNPWPPLAAPGPACQVLGTPAPRPLNTVPGAPPPSPWAPPKPWPHFTGAASGEATCQAHSPLLCAPTQPVSSQTWPGLAHSRTHTFFFFQRAPTKCQGCSRPS